MTTIQEIKDYCKKRKYCFGCPFVTGDDEGKMWGCSFVLLVPKEYNIRRINAIARSVKNAN